MEDRIQRLHMPVLSILSLLLCVGCVGSGDGFSSEEPSAEMAAILEDMAEQKKDFDAESLHEMGVEGLAALLDQLLWQTPEFDGYAGRFSEQYEDHVSKTEQYADAFRAYAMEIEDDARLTLLAERIRRSLQDHGPGRVNERGETWRSSIRALVQHGKDKYPNLLAPLLEQSNVHVAADVVRATANDSPNDYYPELQLTALDSKREPVVREAIKWAPNCWDDSRRAALKKKLIEIFENRAEFKFDAAFPLLHDFGYEPAIDYLIEQTKGDDKERIMRALSWLGDTSNSPTVRRRTSPSGLCTSASRRMRRFDRKPRKSCGTFRKARRTPNSLAEASEVANRHSSRNRVSCEAR